MTPNKKQSKQKYIKPKIKTKKLSLHTLLGENGWFSQYNQDSSQYLAGIVS
ncbi:hypothetical protein KKE45_02790 [Patescibacteria group bacterium]|nr:hypothetical protein [Patescibacteria group bacterium]